MKTITLLFISFFIFQNALIAQSWSPAGARWTYSYFHGVAEGYVEIKYIGDTLINSINCKKLEKSRHVYDHVTFLFYDQIFGIEYTYEQNGVVYLLFNNSVDTLFNFNALPGDSWGMAKYQGSFGNCDSNSTLIVLDTGSITISATLLKYKVVHFNYTSTGFPFPITYIDTIVERIGFLNSYILPYDFCYGMIDGNEGGGLRCYNDSNFATYQTSYPYACDFIIGQQEIQYNIRSMLLSPNPATSELVVSGLEFVGNSEIEIYNVLGEKIYSQQETSNQQPVTVNVSQLPSGIYFVKVKTEKEERVGKFVKE